MNIGLLGGFAGGLASGYFKTREDQREQERYKMLKDAYDRRVKSAKDSAAILKAAQTSVPKSAPDAVQPSAAPATGLKGTDPQDGGFDASPNIGSNAHTAQLLGSMGLNDLATGIDPNWETAKNPDYEPGGSTESPIAGGMTPPVYGPE